MICSSLLILYDASERLVFMEDSSRFLSLRLLLNAGKKRALWWHSVFLSGEKVLCVFGAWYGNGFGTLSRGSDGFHELMSWSGSSLLIFK